MLPMFFVTYGSWLKEFPGLAMGLIFAGCARALLSITLHEYGHGLMAIALGGFCRAIELNALGGLAYCGRFSQQNPGKTGSAICSNILVSIAGPAMNAIQCGLLAWSLSSGGFLTNASPWPSPVYLDHPNLFWWLFVFDAFYFELANVALNVLPIIPGTDGTHIAQYFLRCCGFPDSRVYPISWIINGLLSITLLVFMIKQSYKMDSYMWLALFWLLGFRGEYALWQQLQNPVTQNQGTFIPLFRRGTATSDQQRPNLQTRIVDGRIVRVKA